MHRSLCPHFHVIEVPVVKLRLKNDVEVNVRSWNLTEEKHSGRIY